MSVDIIKDYLVRIGFIVDKKGTNSVKHEIEDVEKSVKELADLFKKLGAAFGLFKAGEALANVGTKLGNITTEVDRFAISLYTTTQNARGLKTVMDTMGIQSLEDLKYINLMPEQRQQFMELRALANELAPDDETKEGLAELRKFGFEFQKMQVQMAAIGVRLLGTLGELMSTPLFQKIPQLVQVIVDILAFLVSQFKKDVDAFKTGGFSGLKDMVGHQIKRTMEEMAPVGKFVQHAVSSVGDAITEPFVSSGSRREDVKKFKAYAIERAKKHGVDPAILMALINQESGWNPKARSSVGALGIGQFMPATAKGMGVDPMNPYSAIDGSARYLKNAMIHFHGNVKSALASYNAGFGAVDKYHGVPPYKETQNYVKSIMGQADRLRKTEITIQVNGAKSPMETAHEIKKTLNGMVLGGSVS